MSSRPEIMRSNVDLPQPDGPTKTTNWPSSMVRSTPRTTSVPPKRFFRFFRTRPVIGVLSFSAFDTGKREALHDLPLGDEVHDEDRHDGECGGGELEVPERQAVGVGKVRQGQGQGEHVERTQEDERLEEEIPGEQKRYDGHRRERWPR